MESTYNDVTYAQADILATCNALGFEVNGAYEKSSDCLNCLRDLLRYLRKDDDSHSTLRYLGSIRLIETDLVPILKRYSDDPEIFDFTLKLMVALTSPAILLFKEEIPEDKESNLIYLQLISYLQSYKLAFYDVEVWKVLQKQIEKIIVQKPLIRSEEENLTLERIFILIRNILHVPTDEMTSNQTDDILSPQDKIIWNIHYSQIDTVLLYMVANEDEYKYCLHVLEMVSLILREHSAETVAYANEERSNTEKKQDMDVLMRALHREKDLKNKKLKTLVSARFNGVYCIKNLKSVSENDYISHKAINDVKDVKFDLAKSSKRKPKNRLPTKEVDTTRRSTLKTRMFLKKFCIEFLKAYNKLMAAVRRELTRKSSEDHDDTYHLWAMEYFMKFNRLYKFDPAFVSETISMHMFHHIQTQITTYQEMMLTDKKKAKLWSKRMRLGVSAYKELLQTLFTMTKSSDENLRKNADNLISNVFYVIEYRELLLSLLSSYDEVKFSLKYLSELIESNYMFLKMLENHSKRHSEVIVQQKQHKVRRRKKKNNKNKESNVEAPKVEWKDIASDLSAAVQDRREIPSDMSPFDGASEIPFEEQKVNAVYKIRGALLSYEAAEAVGLLRTARELWPEGNSFGPADIDSEDEFMVLKEIFESNLEDPNSVPDSAQTVEQLSNEETDEEMMAMPALKEKRLELNDVYKKYATPKVVMPCCLLFNNYENNSSQTNSCLIKLLHKIAWDYKMHALFFQASLFCTFQKVFEDSEVNRNPVTKELSRFAKYILTKFFEVAKKNDKVFVELLFWKGCREAYELEEGYHNSYSASNVRGAWTEDEEEELKYLYDENKNVHIEGQDVADIILANLGTQKRNKHQIILALKRLGLIKSAKDLKPHLRSEWTEDEIDELKHLFEDYKNTDDIMGNILSRLSIKRSKRAVVKKLLELNIIQNSKEVRKKSKSKKKNNAEDDPKSDSSSSDSDEDDRDENVGQSSEDDESFFERLRTERLRNVDEDHTNEGLSSNDMVGSKKDESSKPWDEKEIVELSHLFLKHKEADDALNVILSLLTVKRSKKSVINKLLEVGLIKDKNEVKQKKKLLEEHNNDNSDIDVSELHKLNPVSPSLTEGKSKKKKNRILSDSSDEEEVANNSSKKESSITEVQKKVKKSSNSNFEKVKKQVVPKVWDEAEIIELHRLYSQNRDSNDIIGNIIKGLSVKRSKESVIEKLLETGSIKDRKEVKKKRNKNPLNIGNNSDTDDETPLNFLTRKITKSNSGKKRPPKIWEEQEIAELQLLFQEHKGSDDIMGALLTSLTVKRSKESVIEKLLELSLIQDRKEIRKKRTTKQSNKRAQDSLNSSLNSISSERSHKEKPRRLDSDGSDDEDLLPLRSVMNNTSDEESSLKLKKQDFKINTSDKKKSNKYKIFSDSSDEDALHIDLSPSNEKENGSMNNSFRDPFDDLFEEMKKSSLPSSRTVDHDDLNTRDDGPGLKRKRLMIEDSDDSSNEASSTNRKSKNSLLNGSDTFDYSHKLDEREAQTDTGSNQQKKKRARVLIDSDESD